MNRTTTNRARLLPQMMTVRTKVRAAPLSFAIGWKLSNREGWRFLNGRDSSRRLQNDPDIKDHFFGPQPLIGPKKNLGDGTDFRNGRY